MTDEQLLPDAAKATGRNIAMIQRCSATKATVALIDKWNEDGTVSTYVWAPLSNDADAFRLAVDLGIEVEFFRDCVNTSESSELIADHPDKYAATRVAIVRAASNLVEGSHEQS